MLRLSLGGLWAYLWACLAVALALWSAMWPPKARLSTLVDVLLQVAGHVVERLPLPRVLGGACRLWRRCR